MSFAIRPLVVAALLCGAPWAHAQVPFPLDTPLNLLPPDPQHPIPGHLMSAIPTADGITAAWWDDREFGTPPCVYGCEHMGRFGADGSPIGADQRHVIDDRFPAYANTLHLERVPNGYVVLTQEDGSFVFSVHADADGRQSAPSTKVLERVELYETSYASNDGIIVMVYPQWWGCFLVSERPLDLTGTPAGPGGQVAGAPAAPPYTCLNGGVYGSPVTRSGDGFFTAWVDTKLGVRARVLSATGAPVGPVVPVRPSSCYKDVTGVAVLGTRELVIVAVGCTDTVLESSVRERGGPFAAPVPVAAKPGPVEGEDGGYRAFAVVAARDRFGLVYIDGGPDPNFDRRWLFLELDASGRPLGAPRDLTAEFGVDPVYPRQVELRYDDLRDRYFLDWAGRGPTGYGLWALEIAPRR